MAESSLRCADGAGDGTAWAGLNSRALLNSPELLDSPALLGNLRAERRPLRLPLAGASVAAGFPSPADDYIEVGLDLNELLIRHPSSTFFLRVSGDSMQGAGIQHGDLLVVDRSLEARPGLIVVAVLDGAFTLKRLARHRGRLRLEAANSAYPPLELHQCGDVQIWGVAIHVIHPLARHG